MRDMLPRRADAVAAAGVEAECDDLSGEEFAAAVNAGVAVRLRLRLRLGFVHAHRQTSSVLIA